MRILTMPESMVVASSSETEGMPGGKKSGFSFRCSLFTTRAESSFVCSNCSKVFKRSPVVASGRPEEVVLLSLEGDSTTMLDFAS